MENEIYKINLEVIQNGTGTRQSPYVYEITRGQREGSLIVHTKAYDKYYQYHIERTGPTQLLGYCVCKRWKKCRAKITLKLIPDGKLILLEKTKNENSTKKLDYKLKKND